MNTAQLVDLDGLIQHTLHLAVAAYLARVKGQSRVHSDSDLRAFLDWCSRRGLNPLKAERPHIELYAHREEEPAAAEGKRRRPDAGRPPPSAEHLDAAEGPCDPPPCHPVGTGAGHGEPQRR